MGMGKVDLRLSGGASNSDPDLSIGGVISSEIITLQSAAWDSLQIGGITLEGGSGNDISTSNIGTIVYNGLGTVPKAEWQSPNHVAGYGPVTVDLDASETFILSEEPISGNAGSLRITVNTALLPASEGNYDIALTNPVNNNLFSDVTESQSLTGLIQYRGLYVRNLNATAENIYLAVEQNFISGARIEMALCAEGVDATMETLSNDEISPSNVTWVAPTVSSPLLVPLTANGQYGVWFKRTVHPVTRGAFTPDFGQLRMWIG